MATDESVLNDMLSYWWNKKMLSRMEDNLAWTKEYLDQDKSEWVQWAHEYFDKKGILVC
jgi:hypothetical protein